MGNHRFKLLATLVIVGGLVTGTARAQAPQIEIQIRNTASADDDYLTWAPTVARIRQQPSAGDLRVLLTNDPPGPVPPGRDHPLDGDVVFDKIVAPGQTATKETLELTLPKDGTWIAFVVAGKFPRASSSDRDAIIEVHDATSGAVIHRHALMVRVRKDHRKLTQQERSRFIAAFDYMHRKAKSPGMQSRYMYFVTMHKIAVWGQEFGMDPAIAHFWPDMGHKAPGFIAWHRAFLLQFEREIQAMYPDVTLPYWIMPEKSDLFSEDFLGTNPVDSDPAAIVKVKFSPNNLLYGWSLNGTSLVRGATARNVDDPTFPAFRTDADLFAMTKFSEYPTPSGFIYWVERNPHNAGHGWVGGMMANCQTSPQDPIFWVFHTGFDRQWAHWQYLYGRVKPDGSGDSYHPLGTFPGSGAAFCNATGANQCPPIGHSLGDPMWPWNEKVGAGATKKGSWPQQNLATPFLGAFPAAKLAGLWPSSAASPTPGHTIDYAGATPGGLDMGFAYDDTPFGAKPAPIVPVAAASPADRHLTMVLDAQRPLAERIEAGKLLRLAQVDDRQAKSLLGVLGTPTEQTPLRSQALRTLQDLPASVWVGAASDVLKPSSGADPSLQLESIRALSNELMFGRDGHHRQHAIADVLRRSLESDHVGVRVAALRTLAPMADAQAIATAATALQAGPEGRIPPASAIQALVASGKALEYTASIRPYLAHRDPTVRAAAASALALDPQSRGPLLDLITSKAQPYEVRSVAIENLAAGAYGLLPGVLSVAANPQESSRLRAEALASIGVVLRSDPSVISTQELDQIITTLRALPGGDAIGAVLPRTLSDARTERATRDRR